MVLKHEEINRLEHALKNLKNMSASDAVNALMVLGTSQLPSLVNIALRFMKRFREAVKECTLTSTMEPAIYWAFRGCQTIGQIRACFDLSVKHYGAGAVEVIEAMEALVLLLVTQLEIPAVAQEQLDAATKQMETEALCEISSAVLKARAGGMSEREVLDLLSVFNLALPPHAATVLARTTAPLYAEREQAESLGRKLPDALTRNVDEIDVPDVADSK